LAGRTPKREQEIARPPQQQQQRGASKVKERKRKAAKTMVTVERCEAMGAKYAKKAVPHPLGIATQMVPRPQGGIQSQEEFYQRTLFNALGLSWWMSIQASSLETYQNGWRQWIKWSKEFGTDPWMRVKPPGYQDPRAEETPLLLTFHAVCVLSFCSVAVDRQ
jgi:hypothetical protein